MSKIGVHTGLVYLEIRAKTYAAILAFVLWSVHSYAQSSTSREYNIKAVSLFNFTQFVEWPAASFTRADAPFIIGILGHDPFGSYLDETIAGEQVKGHPIVVQRFREEKDVRSRHILFISSIVPETFKETLTALHSKNVLTVSDIPNFASAGGIVRFHKQENKIKLQVNATAAKAADLNISSKLLRLAEIVETLK